MWSYTGKRFAASFIMTALCFAKVGGALAQTPDSTNPSGERVTLEEAVRRALARNPSAEVAKEEFRRAEALVREARSGSLPTLTGNATYTRLDADRTFNGNVIAGRDQLAANLALNVPLVVPQKWMQWSQAKDNAQAI